MAGIYIHIPFCKSKCNYCDFYSIKESNTNLNKYVQAIIMELELRKKYLAKQTIKTIYFGGGTPSLLSIEQINLIYKQIQNNYTLANSIELTLEANPDDLSKEFLENLKKYTPLNRISIGIQSFNDSDLKLMNRRHNSKQAINSVLNAQKIGFNNISADLIYGLPNMNENNWKKNLKSFFQLDINHLSAYHLTYEKDTNYYKWLKNNKIQKVSESDSILQFEILIKEAEKNSYLHYEISNFCKQPFFSEHNFNYWRQKKYLGIGASAHSYNIKSRQWNISDATKYIKSIQNNIIPTEKEILTEKDRFNEYLITNLRTYLGVNKDYMKEKFNIQFYNSIKEILQQKIDNGLIIEKNNKFILNRKGIFVSDAVLVDLFV